MAQIKMQKYFQERQEKMGNKLYVNQIIPFSNVDGKGNRCAIFLQGCNLSCVYCHNPETISNDYNTLTKVKVYEIEELVDEVKKSIPFIRGVTVSGGEPTLQHKAIKELFLGIKQLGLSCYVDTNGYFDINDKRDLIEVTDKFLFDVKTVDDALRLCNNSKDASLDTLIQLLDMDKIEEVRTVILNKYMDGKKTVETVSKILLNYPEVTYKIIKVHLRGLKKEQIMKIKDFIPSDQDILDLVQICKDMGLKNVKYVL